MTALLATLAIIALVYFEGRRKGIIKSKRTFFKFARKGEGPSTKEHKEVPVPPKPEKPPEKTPELEMSGEYSKEFKRAEDVLKELEELRKR